MLAIIPSVPRSTRSPEPSVTALVTLLAVNLVAAGVLAYSNSFAGAFVLDDFPSIVNNPSIRSLWPPQWLTRRRAPRRPAVPSSISRWR